MSNIYDFKIGVKGLFNISSPFNTVLPSTTQLTVTAVSSISALINEGVDVLNDLYLSAGSTSKQYELDLSNNIQIITLSTDTGKSGKVPANSITNPPVMDGVNYANFILVASLGLLPETFDFESLKLDINSYIASTVGITTTSKIVTYGDPTLLTVDTYKKQEIIRKNRITQLNSTALQLENAKAYANELRAKLTALETYILNNNIATKTN